MNVEKLKEKMEKRGFNVERLAERIGIDRSSLYRKLNASEKFTIGEAQNIRNALELNDDDARSIFFG